MCGQWKAYSQVIGGVSKYIAGRQIDMSEPLHAGNIEYTGNYEDSPEPVYALCERLNEASYD